MTDNPLPLYLIAHLVRGKPAFDVAHQMDMDGEVWWIIPTSGHRAYPYWDCRLDECLVMGMGEYESIKFGVPDPPSSWPDHYPTSTHSPSTDISSLFAKPKLPAITRRL